MNTNFILGKAVEYFNSWDASRRTVGESDVLFVKLRWINYEYTGYYEDQTGFHDGDVSGDYEPEQLKQEIICLWVDGPGTNLTATVDSFVVINAEEFNVGTGVPVFALPDQDGWNTEGPAYIWNELVNDDAFDSTKFAVIAGRNSNPDEVRDDMWLVNPVIDDGMTAGEYQLQRVRPLLHMVEKTITFTLDGSNSSGEETYGDFYAVLPAIMDNDFDLYAYVNPQTAMPANDPTGWFALRLYGEQGSDAVIPMFNILTSDPGQTYFTINDPGTEQDNMRPNSGWYRFRIDSPIPEGFFAEVTLTIVYKQRFVGHDRLSYYIAS